jgi:hypothetical protein
MSLLTRGNCRNSEEQSEILALDQMIDYVSMEIDGRFADMILANPMVAFSQTHITDTGELVIDKYGAQIFTGSIRNLDLIIRKYESNKMVTIKLEGSVHKFQQGQNYRDFSCLDVFNVIDEITQLLGIAAGNIKIHQMEFGLNLMARIHSNQILKNIVSHKGREFEQKFYNNKGYLKRFVWTNYIFKIYDKGLQYQLDQDIIRVEIKAQKMQFFEQQKIRVSTLADLYDVALYPRLEDALIKALSELIFTDTRICRGSIKNVTDKMLFVEYSNTQNWSRAKSEMTHINFKRKVEKYRSLVTKMSSDDVQNTLIDEVKLKWTLLSNCVDLSPLSRNDGMSIYYTQLVQNKETSTTKQCLTCGREISGQKSTSKYCSEKLFGREVKRCRNIISNLRRDELNRYPSQTLFDVDQYLSDEYRRWKSVALKTSI